MYKTYNELIEHTKTQHRIKIKRGIYYAEHHILPKHMGGTDDTSNLVLLTLHEHIQAHYLLALENVGTQFYYTNMLSAHTIVYGKRELKRNTSYCLEVERVLNDPEAFAVLEDIKYRMQNLPKLWAQFGKDHQPQLIRELGKASKSGRVYSYIDSCPICQSPNSNDSFACCKEHEEQFEAERLLRVRESRAQTTSRTWADNSVRKARITAQKTKFATAENKAKRALATSKAWQNEESATKRKEAIGIAHRGKDRNRHWITNGVESICQSKDEAVPEGWHVGRAVESGRLIHTVESKQKIAATFVDRTYIHTDGVYCKRVKNAELQTYLDSGWKLGKNKLLEPKHKSGYKQNRKLK